MGAPPDGLASTFHDGELARSRGGPACLPPRASPSPVGWQEAQGRPAINLPARARASRHLRRTRRKCARPPRLLRPCLWGGDRGGRKGGRQRLGRQQGRSASCTQCLPLQLFSPPADQDWQHTLGAWAPRCDAGGAVGGWGRVEQGAMRRSPPHRLKRFKVVDSTHLIDIPYRHTLSRRPIDTPYQHATLLSTHPINTSNY